MSKAAELPTQKAKESNGIKALSEAFSCRINKAKSNELRRKGRKVEVLADSHRSMEVASDIPVSVLVLVQLNIVVNDLEKGLSS